MAVPSSSGVRGSRMRLGAWALQVGAAAVFFGAGVAKLVGVPSEIQLFDQIGVGQWLRILTGVVEIVGAFALVYPGMAAIGGLWLGFTMLGAGAASAVLLALNALIIYLRRDELLTLVIKAQGSQR